MAGALRAFNLRDSIKPRDLQDLTGTAVAAIVGGTPPGASGYAADPHTLSGATHTGLLASTQATQFAYNEGNGADDASDRSAYNANRITAAKATIAPLTALIYDVGTSLKPWGDAYVKGLTLHGADIADTTAFTVSVDGYLSVTPSGGRVNLDADLYFTGAQTIATSADNLTIAPAGDIVLDPTGNDILPNTNYDVNLGALSKKYLTLHAAELWVETLVAQNTIATIGGRVLVGPTTVLTTDLAPADTTIYVKHNQMASGDRVYLEANGSVEFIAITSAPSGAGPYSYTVTRNLDGTGANQWYAGDAVFNTGTTGDGFIDLYSVSGVKSGAGPTIVGNVRLSATYNDWAEHWALGNLNGVYGYGADTYGFAAGKYSPAADATPVSFVTVDATNGLRIQNRVSNVDAVIGQWSATGVITVGKVANSNSRIEIDSGAISIINRSAGGADTTSISLLANGTASFTGAITASSGSVGSFTIGTYLYTGTKTAYSDTNAGVHLGSDGIGIGNNVFTVSSAGALVATSATITGAITASSGSITGPLTMGGASSSIAIGSTPPSSATVGTGIWLDRTGMYGLSSDVQQAIISATTGAITAGAGAVLLNSGGISIPEGTTYAANRAYKFTIAGTTTAYINGRTSVAQDTQALDIVGLATGTVVDNIINVKASGISASGGTGQIWLTVSNNVNSASFYVSANADESTSMYCNAMTNTFTGSLTAVGGSLTALTGLSLRDTSAAYNVTLAATSSTTLTAGRTLTIDMANSARTIKFTGNTVLNQAVDTTASPSFVNLTATGGVNVGTATGAWTGAIKTSADITTATSFVSNVAAGTSILFNNPASGSGWVLYKPDTTHFAIRQASVGDHIVIADGGVVTMGAYGAGTATFSAAGVISSVSDARAKDWLGPIGPVLDKVLQLNPGYWSWKEGRPEYEQGRHNIGLVAQDIQRFWPELVGESADGMLSLHSTNYGLGILTKAIQEQQQIITAQAARIEALERAA